MTNTEDRARREDDQPARQQLEWDTDKPVVVAARTHLASERIAAAVIEVPGTDPQQYVAIGTVAEIGRLLPEVRQVEKPSYLTGEQIAAGAAVECEHGQANARNVAIDVFDAMSAGALARSAAPLQLADMLAQYRNGERGLPSYEELAALAAQPVAEGEHAGRFDRVTLQEDGSFHHFYQGKPVPGPVGGKKGGAA